MRRSWMVLCFLMVLVFGFARTSKAAEPQWGGEQPQLMSMKSQAKPLSYSNQAAGLSGEILPSPNCRLVLLEVAFGNLGLNADAVTLKLVTTAGDSYPPIGIGGSIDQIVPLDKLPVGRVVGMVQPGGAMFLLTQKQNGATVEVDKKGVLALVYDVPEQASLKFVAVLGLSIPVEK